MTDAPIAQDGGAVVIRGDGLPLMYRCILAQIQRRHRDGLAAHPLLIEARTVLYRACMSQQRHKDDDRVPAEGSCNGQDGSWISVAEAADS